MCMLIGVLNFVYRCICYIGVSVFVSLLSLSPSLFHSLFYFLSLPLCISLSVCISISVHISCESDSTNGVHPADFIRYRIDLLCKFCLQRKSSDSESILNVPSLGHALHAYVNGVFVGSAHGSRTSTPSLLNHIQLNNGVNKISMLSVMVGLKDSGAYLEHVYTGIGSVSMQDK